MRTAMQELIERYERLKAFYDNDSQQAICFGMVINDAKSLLQKEKQQIVDAANYCNTNPPIDNISSGDRYYNETFNQ